MRRTFGALVSLGLFASMATGCFAGTPSTPEVEAQYGKLLRGTKITSIKPSPVEGLFEVVAGPNVFYLAPKGEGHLIFGVIVDKAGKNLTADVQNAVRAKYQEVAQKVAAEKLKHISFDNAIKTGNGPNVVIEFTDPDCPYCRRVDSFLSQRSDITRYTFLNPIDSLHPSSRAQSIFILSSKDKSAALRDVFSGKYDRGGLPLSNADFGKYPSEVKQLAEGMNLGRELGVQGTPLLFVNGTMVNGADIPKITQLLAK